MGSGEGVVVSIHVSCVNTSDGVVRSRPDLSSCKMERSVGSVGLSGVLSAVRRMDLWATLGFFTNMRRKGFAIFQATTLPIYLKKHAVFGASPSSLIAWPNEAPTTNIMGR